MCGIAGFISQKFKAEDLYRMTTCLQHRGPDADGVFIDGNTGVHLGHRRLSILDLSAAANQPFYSHNKRYVMIYNGEVYNYKEVKAKYKIESNTTSDSEIILEAFAIAGVEMVKDLNGMFAMAIWDKQEEKLFLFRDRVGIKPMYYHSGENGFAFASELKALSGLPIQFSVNRQSVANFLYLGYIPNDQTIYNECKKLLPGHYALYSKSGLEISAYWSLEKVITPNVLRNEEQAKDTLRQLVHSSVDYCMISDVPVGVFLSGGVDSSTVAASASKSSPQKIKTFSIGFNDKKYNESAFARQVAEHIGSEHYEFMVTEKDAIDRVDSLTDIYDEPYADSSAIPTLIVSELARKYVKVALSGDGGDELFMGYGAYFWARRLENPFFKTFRKPIGQLLNKYGNNRLKRGSQLFLYKEQSKIKSHIFSQEQYYFTESEISRLMIDPLRVDFPEDLPYYNRNCSLPEKQSFFDILNYLPEELLVKADRASMHHSLEIRVPLLDYRLVEFAVNLSQDLKLKGDTGKYLLKEVLYEMVPREIFNRPKWGFAVPLQKWLGTELRYLVDEYLSSTVVEECGLVNVKEVERLKAEFFNGQSYQYNKLWTLVILHKWYKKNLLRNDSLAIGSSRMAS
jgi:asparagine synthase (glutamine-hydrolysing)